MESTIIQCLSHGVFINLVGLDVILKMNIINDILDVSKIEAGKLELEVVNFNIIQLVKETIRAHSASAAVKELDLNYAKTIV